MIWTLSRVVEAMQKYITALFDTYSDKLKLNQFLMTFKWWFWKCLGCASLLLSQSTSFLRWFALSETHCMPLDLFPNHFLVTAITPFKYKTQSYLPKLASQSNYSQNYIQFIDIIVILDVLWFNKCPKLCWKDSHSCN